MCGVTRCNVLTYGMKNNPVEWRPVVGYEGYYEVSSEGDVRRVKRPDSLGRPRRCGLLKKIVDRGYVRFSLCQDRRAVGFAAHRLVAIAFLGPPPTPDHVINHRDGVKSNNHPSNLEYATRSENTRHAVRMGLHPSGQRHGMARLLDAQTETIRREWNAGMSIARLAALTAMSERQISRIVRREARLVG